ncbi:MAG: ATP-binding cassette domain-containing protein [Microbacterium sp.]
MPPLPSAVTEPGEGGAPLIEGLPDSAVAEEGRPEALASESDAVESRQEGAAATLDASAASTDVPPISAEVGMGDAVADDAALARAADAPAESAPTAEPSPTAEPVPTADPIDARSGERRGVAGDPVSVEERTAPPDAEPAESVAPPEESAAAEAVADADFLEESIATEPLSSRADGEGLDVVRTDDEAPSADIDGEAMVDAGTSDAVRVRGVSKSFGATRAVDAIDLTIPAGTFYGIVGPNGAGKTTTLSMIAGLLAPDAGTIEVAGIDARVDPRGAKRAMGVLPDRLRTFDRLTGRQLLHYYGVLRGLKPAVADSRASDLARAFDLTDALGRSVADYSAGMTKKIMLAGAMIHSPRVLVLDEPFEAVDPVSSAVILDILSAYVSHGGTVVLSSHGMDLVERVCTSVAVIVAGRVLAEGSVSDVRGELTLEQRFVELAGGLSDVEGLEWLHTFSD